MNAPNEPRKGVIAQAVASYAAIAACITAALYLAGIATLWVRLRNAGLSAPDVLPNVSLDQLLRYGLTWISPVVPALLVLAVLLAASVWFEWLLDRRAAAFETAWAPKIEDPDEREKWLRSFRELRHRTAWSDIRSEVKSAISQAPNDPARDEWKDLSRALALFNAWTWFVVVVLIAALFLLPPVLAGVTAGAVVVAGVIVDTRPALAALTPLFAVLALAFLANAIVNPRPLPLATVITADAPKGHSGDFLLSTDAAWYLGKGGGTVLVISADDIECSRLTSRPRQDPIWRLLLEKKESDPKPGKLSCGAGPASDVEAQHAIVVPVQGQPVCGELALGPGGEVELRGMPKLKAVKRFHLVKRCPK